MTIDLKTIKHISKLSRISVDDKKAKKLAGDLNSIFEFIEKLNKLNTKNIEPDFANLFDFPLGEGRSKIVNYAMSNTFGFGGHIASIVLKKYSGQNER